MNNDDRPIIVFDGDCDLCRRSVRFVLRRDRAGRFRLAANRSPAGRRLLADRGLDPDRVDSVVLIDRARTSTHADAVLRIAAGLDAPWRWLAALARCIPRPLRDALYRFVAKRRSKWFGQADACAPADPLIAERYRARTVDR